MKQEGIGVEGEVIEVCGAGRFRVRLANDSIVLAYVSPTLTKNHITVILGDTVKLELSPYDLTKGRIVYRNR